VSSLAVKCEYVPASAEQLAQLAATARRVSQFVRASWEGGIRHVNDLEVRFWEATGSAQIEKIHASDTGVRLTILEALGRWAIVREAYYPPLAERDDGLFVVATDYYPLTTIDATSHVTYEAQRQADGQFIPLTAPLIKVGQAMGEADARFMKLHLEDLLSGRHVA